MEKCGIVGSNHCGSSIVSLALNGNPNIFAVGESNKFSRDYCQGDYYDFCNIHGENCYFWDKKTVDKIRNNLDKIQSIINKRVSDVFDPKTIVYSDKMMSHYKEALENNNVFDSYICLWKNPIGWYHSKIRHEEDEVKINVVIGRYYGFYKRALKFLEDKKVFYLFYENFAKNPQTYLYKLSSFLNTEYHPNMIEFEKAENHILGGNRGANLGIYNKEKRKKLLTDKNSIYSKENYYKNNHFKIKLDKRYEKEINDEDKTIIKHSRANYIFQKLMEKRT